MAASLDELKAHAKSIRRNIIKITTEAGSGHPSSSMSAVEVVTYALYFGGFMRPQQAEPARPEARRSFSARACVPVLYSALCEAGYLHVRPDHDATKLGIPFEGHPNMKRLDTMEASTGSLGQGLSIGVGQALACRLDGYDAHTYVMMGDGEMGEGQNWKPSPRRINISSLI